MEIFENVDSKVEVLFLFFFSSKSVVAWVYTLLRVKDHCLGWKLRQLFDIVFCILHNYFTCNICTLSNWFDIFLNEVVGCRALVRSILLIF